MSFIIQYAILLFLFPGNVNTWYQDEIPLQEKLFNKYDSNVRPSESRDYITVEFDFRLQSLVDFDVRKQVLTIVSMTMMRWKDPQLSWKKETHWLDEINVDSRKIWTPDVVLYNTAEKTSLSHLDIYKTKPMINHEGYVTWNAPVTWTVSCSSDITWFPVDQQVCIMNFGSWSYPRSKLNLEFYLNDSVVNDKGMNVFQVENGEWEIVNFDSCTRNVIFPCCKEPFAAISYMLVLDRLSLYYFIYIILPLISLTVLFMLVFFIPHDSGERTGFGVTVLLSITVYLLVISEQLPEKSNQTPVLGICFTELFFILSFALGMAVLTMNLPRLNKKPPRFLAMLISKDKQPIKDDGPDNFDDEDMIEETALDEYHHSGTHRSTVKSQSNEEMWNEISVKLDRIFFAFFFLLVIVVPAFTIIRIPSSGRADAKSQEALQCFFVNKTYF